MEKKTSKKEKIKCDMNTASCGTGGAFYFLGFIGALIYYVTNAVSVWDAIFGFFKALVWPAFLVYELLVFLGMQ